MVPWLIREEQNTAFPPGIRFDHPDEQKSYVKKWLIEEAKMPIAADKLDISFYALVTMMIIIAYSQWEISQH